ncbi:uncharacterized protein LOC112567909 [Pomacea canaliculata]|uniref:uncharacterized protein LOC112567909 n=1 Tax=Pomacea canaliculata TaxID=400727 RepID=UPI000D728CA2|nr:uncharacterized protein LOC112567909 [Pomacea canaliculata]XP_025100576.1 uncharacterized protein LOC112567909 [Pomacea canaliculata]
MAQACRSKQKKRRNKSNCIKNLFYNVPDILCDRINVKEVTDASGATINWKTSTASGKTTFIITGTRSQSLEALRLISTMTGEPMRELQKAHKLWLEWIKTAFPLFDTRSYFLPPVYIRRVPMTQQSIACQRVFILKTEDRPSSPVKHPSMTPSSTERPQVSNIPCVQQSDMHDDEAIERVLVSLKIFSKLHKEVFMCLSQFSFGSYLGEPRFAAAHLPLPSNLPSTLPWSWRQGDFDVLLIHKLYGFVIMEIKAVGCNIAKSQEEKKEYVRKKLTDAIEQLNKAEAMLKHLVSDITSGVRITKAIACPNLTAKQIHEVLLDSVEVQQALCNCIKVDDPNNTTNLVLSSDHLLSPQTPKDDMDDNVKTFKQWWQNQVVGSGPDAQLGSLYLDLLARFCGPASTITVPCTNEPRISMKTMDQAVAHVGNCYSAQMTLFPEQMDLLTRAPRRVFVAGPPGTGKSTVLLLIGLVWLEDGKDVYVLSTWNRSLFAAIRIRYLLQEALKTPRTDIDGIGRVLTRKKNFRRKTDMEEVLTELTQVASQKPLYVIADEVGPNLESECYIFPKFCESLLQRCHGFVDHLNFWVASNHNYVAPEEFYNGEEGWERHCFTRPLRPPPPVLQEIKKAVEIKRGIVQDYSERSVPDHTDGPPVKWFYHHPEQHACSRVEDCNVCGKDVANFLIKKLRLRLSASAESFSDLVNNDNTSADNRHRLCLQYKDVLILSWVQLHEDAPVLKALRDADIPVQVMSDSESDIEDVATARSNVVWAARQQLVCGSMRKVVVVLSDYDDSKGQYVFTRLSAMSRCTSQLVVVCPPPEDESD